MNLTAEQRAILDHTANKAAGGRYCGDSPDMQKLVELGLMESAGRLSFVPDEYFRLTSAGRRWMEGAHPTPTIAVLCSDGRTGTYVARVGNVIASATSAPGNAVRRCAAKALGLCPERKPDGMFMSDYSRLIDAAAVRVEIRKINATNYEACASGGAA